MTVSKSITFTDWDWSESDRPTLQLLLEDTPEKVFALLDVGPDRHEDGSFRDPTAISFEAVNVSDLGYQLQGYVDILQAAINFLKEQKGQ